MIIFLYDPVEFFCRSKPGFKGMKQGGLTGRNVTLHRLHILSLQIDLDVLSLLKLHHSYFLRLSLNKLCALHSIPLALPEFKLFGQPIDQFIVHSFASICITSITTSMVLKKKRAPVIFLSKN